jgi:hypothetical protein
MEFFKRYFLSIAALLIALMVLFFLLNLAGKRAPGVLGTAAEKAGALASGQAYSFSS